MRPAVVETPTAEADIVPGWLDRLTLISARTKGTLPLALRMVEVTGLSGDVLAWVIESSRRFACPWRVLVQGAVRESGMGELRKERKWQGGILFGGEMRVLRFRCFCF